MGLSETAFVSGSEKEQSGLKKMVPDMEVIESLSQKYNLIGFYCYAPADEAPVAATTRMFVI